VDIHGTLVLLLPIDEVTRYELMGNDNIYLFGELAHIQTILQMDDLAICNSKMMVVTTSP
jgi:hypothetical protein